MWEMSERTTGAETKFKPARKQYEIFSPFYISSCRLMI